VNLKEWKKVLFKKGITDDKNPYQYDLYVYEINN
jgi:hypothetical protein